MRRISQLVVVALVMIVCATASAEGADDTGGRVSIAMGYPALLGFGGGYKFDNGTEVLLHGSMLAAMGFVTSGELTVSQDLLGGHRGSLYAGASGAVMYLYLPAIDCYGPEPCYDQIETYLLTGVRAGGRLRVADDYLFGGGTLLALEAGPQLGVCLGDCAGGLRLGLAVELRVVFPFGSSR